VVAQRPGDNLVLHLTNLAAAAAGQQTGKPTNGAHELSRRTCAAVAHALAAAVNSNPTAGETDEELLGAVGPAERARAANALEELREVASASGGRDLRLDADLEADAVDEAADDGLGQARAKCQALLVAQQQKRALIHQALPKFMAAVWAAVDGGDANEYGAKDLMNFNLDPMFFAYVQILTNLVEEPQKTSQPTRLLGAGSHGGGSEALAARHRDAAFAHFADNGKRLMRLVLNYFHRFVGAEYTGSNSYLLLALCRVLAAAPAPGAKGGNREALDAPHVERQREQRQRVAFLQEALRRLGATELCMAVISLGYDGAQARRLGGGGKDADILTELSGAGGGGVELLSPQAVYFHLLAPQVQDFANALLAGGNRQVQDEIYSTYLGLQVAESADPLGAQGNFLRSLQAQLREVKDDLLGLSTAQDTDFKGKQSTDAYRFNAPPSTTGSAVAAWTPNGAAASKAAAAARAEAAESTEAAAEFAAEFLASPREQARLLVAQQRAISLLIFLQSFAEGHVKKHQDFLREQPGQIEMVNLVKEVGKFFCELLKVVRSQLKTKQVATKDGQDQTTNSQGPNHGGATQAEGGRLDKFRLVAWDAGLDFELLRLLTPVLTQSLWTMQELCQGPNRPNQMALVLCGVCKAFPPLFAFCGALQLRRPAPGLAQVAANLPDPERAAFRDVWARAGQITAGGDLPRFPAMAAAAAAASGVAALSPRVECPGSEWVGSDPVLCYLMTQLNLPPTLRDEVDEVEVSAALGWRLGAGLNGPDTWTQGRPPDGDTSPRARGNVYPRNEERDLLLDAPALNLESSDAGAEACFAEAAESPAFGARRRRGGWLLDKELFLEARAAAAADGERALPRGGLYHDVSRLCGDFFALERALLQFVQSLADGSDTGDPASASTMLSAVRSGCFPRNESFLGDGDGGGEGERLLDASLEELKSPVVEAALNWMQFAWRNPPEGITGGGGGGESSGPGGESLAGWDTATSYHILLETLGDVGALPKREGRRYKEAAHERGLDFSLHVGRVEVLDKHQEVAVMYFPVPEVVRWCWDNYEVRHVKQRILYPDDLTTRSNPDEKLKHFLKEAGELVSVLRHEFDLAQMRAGREGRRWQVLASVGHWYWHLSALSLALSLAVNGFLLFNTSYSYDPGLDGATPHLDATAHEIYLFPFLPRYGLAWDGLPAAARPVLVLFRLLVVHALTAFLVLLSYVVSTGSRHVAARVQQNPRGVLALAGWAKLAVQALGGDTNPATLGPSGVRPREGQGSGGAVEVRLPRWCWVLYYFFVNAPEARSSGPAARSHWDWRAAYHTWFLAMSLCGLWAHPLCYVTTMAEVARGSTTMQYTIRALTKHSAQVGVTIVFMLLLLYAFAAFSFSQDYSYRIENHHACREDFEMENEDAVCGGSFIDRFRLHVDYGVLGLLVWNDSEGPIKTDLGRVFGFAYFFLVNLVITAIVSGIIIDTFSEMRTASKDVHLDLQKSCFVCDLESDDFERSGVSYQSHLKEDHNLWKYVWLIMHLRQKERTDYTGLEMHVAPLLDRHSTRAFPIKKSKAIQGKIKSELKEDTLPSILGKVKVLDLANKAVVKQVAEVGDKVDAMMRTLDRHFAQAATHAANPTATRQSRPQAGGLGDADNDESSAGELPSKSRRFNFRARGWGRRKNIDLLEAPTPKKSN